MNFAWNYIFKSKLIVNLQFFFLGRKRGVAGQGGEGISRFKNDQILNTTTS